jgi:hypothetical protein
VPDRRQAKIARSDDVGCTGTDLAGRKDLSLLGAFVARPLPTANMTTATMFRVIEAARPTLLVDEADTFLSEAEELRGIINAGHCRASATVLRTVDAPDGYEVREFSVWAPMANCPAENASRTYQ